MHCHPARPGLGARFPELQSISLSYWLPDCYSKCQNPQLNSTLTFPGQLLQTQQLPESNHQRGLKAIKGTSIRNADDPSLLIQDSMGLVLTCANINTTKFFNHHKIKPLHAALAGLSCASVLAQVTAPSWHHSTDQQDFYADFNHHIKNWGIKSCFQFFPSSYVDAYRTSRQTFTGKTFF